MKPNRAKLEFDICDPSWDDNLSKLDSERQLAVAVIARAFDDLYLDVSGVPTSEPRKDKSVYENKRLRNAAILFLASNTDREEWYESRVEWAGMAGYCPDKIRTKAIEICKKNNFKVLSIACDLDDELPVLTTT